MENNHKFDCVTFLDCDGVLNGELFYRERYAHLTRYDGIPFYKTVKKYLRKMVKSKQYDKMDYYRGEMCPNKMSLMNELCIETNSAVVLSASMRGQYSVEELQIIFNECGATFTIIDKTGHCECRNRGCEIKQWLDVNVEKWFNCKSHEFYRYAIIDDDSDFLLGQQAHFFQTDNWFGLTPTIMYKVKHFLTHKTF